MNNNKKVIYTEKAPMPIGPYSQAVKTGNLVFISGQIAIDPTTNQLDIASIENEVLCVFNNLKAICEGAGSSINNIIKLNLYLTDLTNFSIVNDIMKQYFNEPYPARAVVEVANLPKGVRFEAEGVLQLD
ncbi:MAG: Rid family detoxifying hydrolase [Gammaproteobacteria bacterium]|nr:Rid family detoxifying hydrolase [Gammaproteobacteria bacterium]